MRLINADAIVHYQTYDDEHEDFPEHESTIADFLDEMTDEGCPKPVDAVPVVRCEDCKHKHYYQFPPKYDTRPYCDKHEKVVTEHDYCSWGERKDGEQDG